MSEFSEVSSQTTIPKRSRRRGRPPKMEGHDEAKALAQKWASGPEDTLPFSAYEETRHMAYAGEGDKFKSVMEASLNGDARATYEVTKVGQRIRYRLRGVVGREQGVGLGIVSHNGELTFGLIRKNA